MHNLYQNILNALQKEDKEQAVHLSIEALETKQVSVIELYEQILRPALASVVEEFEDENGLFYLMVSSNSGKPEICKYYCEPIAGCFANISDAYVFET